jgi:hypothetical protein
MKRTYFLRIAIFSFFLAGLTLVSPGDQLQAQTNSTVDKTYSIPQEVFVAPAVAIVRLDGALTAIKTLMQQQIPGSQEYKDSYAKFICYETTMNSIMEGKGVAVSIVDGLIDAGSDVYDLPKGMIQTYRTGLIYLLKL